MPDPGRHVLPALAAAAVLALALAGCGGGAIPGRIAGPSTSRPAALTSLDAARATLASTGLQLPPDCIPKNGDQIQVGVIASFTSTLTVAGQYGTELTTALDGSLCGVGYLESPPPGVCPPGTVAALAFTVPADGQMFPAPQVKITLVPGVTPTLPNVKVQTEKIVATVCASHSVGAIHLSLTIEISASDSFFGTNCAIGPLRIPLSGVLYGYLGDFTATMTAIFGIPAIAPSAECPAGLTRDVSQVFQFPTAPNAAHLSLTAHGEAYCDVPNSITCSLPTGGD